VVSMERSSRNLRNVASILLMLAWGANAASTDTGRAQELYQHSEYASTIETLLGLYWRSENPNFNPRLLTVRWSQAERAILSALRSS
jgi:hypothetical protein